VEENYLFPNPQKHDRTGKKQIPLNISDLGTLEWWIL